MCNGITNSSELPGPPNGPSFSNLPSVCQQERMIQKGFQITKIETVMQNVFAAAAASSTGEPRQLL